MMGYLMKAFFVYLLCVNMVTFAVFGADKHRAIKGKWRISEASLLLLSAVGGSIGALIGMHVFRHKTRKPKFKAGIPVILLMQIVFACFIAQHMIR